ncbi:hypothetical protein BJ165DRAFT_1477840 [Panaeolus papilionaceus]|nr:hypothetical protein BJ165DRAFT_1477840 [Panaeolus papilionaceus]
MSQLEKTSSPKVLVEKLDGTACATAGQNIFKELDGLLRAHSLGSYEGPLREQVKQYRDLFEKEDWFIKKAANIWWSYIDWIAAFFEWPFESPVRPWKPLSHLAKQLAELSDDADESLVPLLANVSRSFDSLLNEMILVFFDGGNNPQAKVRTRRGLEPGSEGPLELVPMAAILRTVSDNMMNAQNTMRGLRMSMIVLRIRYEDLSSRYVDSSSFKDDIFRDPFWCPSLWTSDIKWAIFDHAHATKDMMNNVRVRYPDFFPGFKLVRMTLLSNGSTYILTLVQRPRDLIHKPAQISYPIFNDLITTVIPGGGRLSLQYNHIRYAQVDMKPRYKHCEPIYRKITVVGSAFTGPEKFLDRFDPMSKLGPMAKLCQDTHPVYQTSASVDGDRVHSLREFIIRLTCTRDSYTSAVILCRDQPCRIIDYSPRANSAPGVGNSNPLSITVEQPDETSVVWHFRERRKDTGFSHALRRFFGSDHRSDSKVLGENGDELKQPRVSLLEGQPEDEDFEHYYEQGRECNKSRSGGRNSILPLHFPLAVTLETDVFEVDFTVEMQTVVRGVCSGRTTMGESDRRRIYI